MNEQTLTKAIDSRFELVAEFAPFISYVHYDNNQPVIKAFTLRTTDGRSYSNVTLQVKITALGQNLAEPFEMNYGNVSPLSPAENLSIRLLPDPLQKITDNTSAEIEFALLENGVLLGTANQKLDALPMNMWALGHGSLSDALLLAAFVQPTDPILPQIIERAREIKSSLMQAARLEYTEGFAGYQSDAEAVELEVKSLYMAVQSYGVGYSNPLPNFTMDGQPIRTPTQIVTEKSATCLDTAILMASLMEHVNIHPILVLVPSHAYVGWWRKDKLGLPAPVADMTEQAGLIKSDLVSFIETTYLCNGTTFEEALTCNENQLADAIARVGKSGSGEAELIDVKVARWQSQVKPLPSRGLDENGNPILVSPVLPPIQIELNFAAAVPRVSLAEDTSPPRVKLWKNSLLDLSFNNPLLNRGRRSRQTIEILIPNGKLGGVEDMLQSENAEIELVGHEFEQPLAKEHGALPTWLQEHVAGTLVTRGALVADIPVKTYATRLRALARSATVSKQETGLNNLYITFGSLTWERKDDATGKPSGEMVTSPLLLIPIDLKTKGKGQFKITLDDSGEIAPNQTLALKLAEYGLNIPLLSNPEPDQSGYDVDGLLAQVREQVLAKGFNSWMVEEDCTIGTFDFSTFHMWKDINDNWETLASAPLVKHLIEADGATAFEDPKRTEGEFTASDLDAEIAKLPLPTDETQVKAILKSLTGESFIIQGPPGTGKSQTITNLLARNLKEGKRILFMSEKSAALAVVKERLEEIGLGDFVLDLHDKGTKPATIRAQLNRSLDAKIQLDEAALEAANFDYGSALRILERYPDRLHAINERFGESVYSAHDKALAIETEARVTLTRALLATFGKPELEEFKNQLVGLPDIGPVAGTAENNAWSLSTLLDSNLTVELKDQIRALAKEIAALFARISANARVVEIFSGTTNIDDLVSFSAFNTEALPTIGDLAVARTSDASIARATVKNLVVGFQDLLAKSPHATADAGKAEIARLEELLEQVQKATLFKGKKRQDVVDELRRYLTGDISTENFLRVFDELKLLKTKADELTAAAISLIGVGASAAVDPFDPASLERLRRGITNLDNMIRLTDPSEPSAQVLLGALQSGIGAELGVLADLGGKIAEMSALLGATAESTARWQGSRNFAETLRWALPKWGDSAADGDLVLLTRWCRLCEMLVPLSSREQGVAVNEILTGVVSYTDAPGAFEASYLNLVLEKLVEDQELNNFEGRVQDQNVAKIGGATARLREANRELIASVVAAGRKFDPTARSGVAGALRAELDKTKRLMPIRTLLHKFWPSITQIAPIVAASPDSVARFLNIETAKFDLVVFDEASQIRVAHAIGALGRASSAIIVGDSKQMPPSSMFQIGKSVQDDDYNEEIEVYNLDEEESILSMAVSAEIPDISLDWHYRSQDEILIAFSNKAYYGGRLLSFPSPKAAGDSSSVKFIEVPDGVYVNRGRVARGEHEDATAISGALNTNEVEARKIVEAVVAQVMAAPANNPPSIGIITMNEQQKDLILALLDETGEQRVIDLKNNEINKRNYLFVRSLEKVQGDERDYIYISMAFSKDPETGKLSQNFGPLIQVGSERRLNVAVTRARREIFVYASFRPSDLNTDSSKSEGMRDLKKFLEFAESGPSTLGLGNSVGARKVDRHRRDIASALKANGHVVHEDLGLSNFRVDVAVEHPEKPGELLLGILLDGLGWKQRLTANDRDVLPVIVLEKNMKWAKVERVWLPMWQRDRAGELARLEESIKLALLPPKVEEPVKPAAPATPVAEEAPAPEAKTEAAPAKLGVDITDIAEYSYTEPSLTVPSKDTIDKLDTPMVEAYLNTLVPAILENMGAFSEKRLAKYISVCFGLGALTKPRAAELVEAIKGTGVKQDAEGFFYPGTDEPLNYKDWFRQAEGTGRDVNEISLIEISNAMQTLCQRTAGMQNAELKRQTAAAFGRKVLSAAMDERMQKAIELGISRGMLAEAEGLVTAL